MDSRTYWKRREAEALKHYIRDEKAYSKELNRIYQNMLDECETQINAFYSRYANKEGITLAEAKKRVREADIKAFERKAKKYVKDKDFSKKANEEMRLYNATMRINRLEMLKANIGLEMIAGHDELEKFMSRILKGRTMAELERQAGILGKTVRNNGKAANAIVNGSFKNGTFSDRIWQYQDQMRQDLGGLLQTGLIQGKNPRAIAGELRKYWYGNDPKTGGGAEYCMERLMRTELARVQTEAQKQSFIRNGFDKYHFIVNSGCCGHCEEVADKDSGYGKGVYLVKDMQPGLNAPPLHPNDRCSTAAYEDSAEYEAWLDYLDKGGTTAEWNRSGKAKWLKSHKPLENPDNSSIISSGARILNPYSDEGEEFAAKYYAEVNSFSTDIAHIASNTGHTTAEIERVKNYLFKTAGFTPDCAIAHSWQRLMLGENIKPHDYMLIEHELYEMEIKRKNPGIEHRKAHAIATQKYNYQKAADEYYGNLKKRNKKQ